MGILKRESTENLIIKAEALTELGEYEQAFVVTKRVAARKINRTDYLRRLAELFRIQRRPRLAIRLLQKAINIEPADFTLHEDLLKILLDTNDFEEAIEACLQLIAVFPKHVIARDVLGIAYMQHGMIDEALRVTEDLIRLDPTSGHHHFKKAVLLQQKGAIAPAMASFLRVLDMEPDTEVAYEAREAIEALDNYQLKQILTIAAEDSVFKAKLTLDPAAASMERGFLLSGSGMLTLRQVDIDNIPGEPKPNYYS